MGKRSAPAAFSPVAVSTTTTTTTQPPPPPPQQKRRTSAAALGHKPTTTTTTSTLVPLDRRQADLAAFSRGDRDRPHHNVYAYDEEKDNEDDYDEEGDENDDAVASPPPRKTHRAQMHQQSGLTVRFGSDTDAGVKCRNHLPNVRAYTADRHSCLAVPYGANDARTTRYFDLVISKAKAPIVCAFAGKIKGKAIYADRDIEQSSRIWTEAPFVAMQHEANRGHLRCCQYCFVPLLSEYKSQWHDMAARWNAAQQGGSNNGNELPVGDDELDLALQQLEVNRKNCGLAVPGATCSCGEVYCSKFCQIRAFHEYHSILCPRDDPYSAMNEFLGHMRHTNDIFLLVAKVIARLLSRFFTTRDIIKAREPMDMFYKKPWWEVVMMEKQIQHIGDPSPMMNMDVEAFAREYSHHRELQSQRGRGRATASNTKGAADSSNVINTVGSKPPPPPTATTLPREGLNANLDDLPRGVEGANDDGIEAHYLRELLTFTHQLLLDAIESNLVHLEREDQLHGLSVDNVWTSCASILSFEFFAAQLGLFEMNNVSMEIDHPFRGLIEILDPDVHAETDDPVIDENQVVNRVRRVLEYEEARLTAQRQQEQQMQGDDDAGFHGAHPSHGEGFLGVEGTALFPIICTMNHSCEPNCTVLYTKDGNAHVVAVRDIHKGDELCICYIDIDDDVRTREANLREYQFKCFCLRCSDERRAIDVAGAQQHTTPNDSSAASSRHHQQ